MSLNFIEFIFFFYIFIGLYMLNLFIFLYIPNKDKLFNYPKSKPEKVSVIIPCYNASANIGRAIDGILNLNYPKEMIEIIVVDDKSLDNSREIVMEYARKNKNVRLIENKGNSGGAAEPTNIGIRNAKNELIVVADDDSVPERGALNKMLGFLQEDDKVGAVTCAVMTKNENNFMRKLQKIEYAIIAWNRKLLDLVYSVYVTPGPFALYRKSVLLKAGLFDTKNMTQDIEIVWRLLSIGYKARMCLDARVYTETPDTFGKWFKQRIRWNIGGTQCLIKYRRLIFKSGMLGNFIIPFFSFSLFLGVLGLGIFSYLLFKRVLLFYLSTKYSIYADTALLHLQELNFSPSILNLFGAALFISGSIFTFTGLGVMKQQRKGNLFNIFFYMLIYLAIYPFIMITALYKLARGKYSW